MSGSTDKPETTVTEAQVSPAAPPASRPPMPGLRTMAVVRWLILLGVLGVTVATFWMYVVQPEAEVRGPDRYYCPMHPEIRSPVPGTCPICFMNLEPIPDERSAAPAPEPPAPSTPEPGRTPTGLAEVMLTLERRQTAGIATTPAVQRTVARELRLPAVIEAPERAVSEVRVRAAGFVERVEAVETGSRVRAGQPLLWLYSPEIVRAEEELLAAVRLGAAQPSEGASDSTGHGLGAGMRDAARQRLSLLGLAEADIDQVQTEGRAQRLVAVRAPAAGIVTARDVAVGTYATPEMRLFQVTDLSKVWASATVTSEDAAQVHVGMRGRFVSRTRAEGYDVQALLVEPNVSVETRTGRARFVAKATDAQLRPGEIGEVLISGAASDQVLVPRDAVIDVGDFRYVFVERTSGVFAPRIVEVGSLFGEERAIVRGLLPGERVVTRGGFVLDSESRLQAALSPAELGAAPVPAPAPAHVHGETGAAP